MEINIKINMENVKTQGILLFLSDPIGPNHMRMEAPGWEFKEDKETIRAVWTEPPKGE